MDERLKKLDVNWRWNTFLEYRARKLRGIRTGFPKLDRLTGGLAGIVVIQGAPGCNKSTFALQVALKHAADYGPALVLDRENGREYWRERALCSLGRLCSATVKQAPTAQLKELLKRLEGRSLYLETEPVAGGAEIKQLLLAADEASGGGKPLLLVVDSIQAMPALASEERQSLQAWMRELDQLKLDFSGRLTILVTSEKRRGEGGQEYERASLSAGKGAGAIEYKAERVFDLRRNRSSGGITCEVVKNREGVSGVSVDLELIYERPEDPNSFCYLLQEAA